MVKSNKIDEAVSFFIGKDYTIKSQTQQIIVFQSEKKEVNWILVFALCCFGILPGLIYYFGFASYNIVTVSLAGARVTATGNTKRAKKDAREFMQLMA